MNPHYYYLIVDVLCLSIPLAFSFHPRLKFHKKWTSFVIGMILMMALFIPWDIFFTAKAVWGFNPEFVTGINFIGLPMEEWLFFICIPYASLFTYHSLNLLLKKSWEKKRSTAVLIFLSVLFMVIGLAFYDRWYTCSAFILCSLFLAFHLLFRKYFLPHFLRMYVIILIPFILSNGILTGLDFWNYPVINSQPGMIIEKIVWYNNDANMGIRLFTIPIEDVAYGMLMLGLVVAGFEWNERRKNLNGRSAA